MTLEEFRKYWKDTPEHQAFLIEKFKQDTDTYPILKDLRDFVEQNFYGFGCRSFYMLHKMLVESFDKDKIRYMEIGVHRAQLLVLYGLLAQLCNKEIEIIGITPLDETDGHWQSDYKKDIEVIHDRYNLKHPTIIKGLSNDPEIIKRWNDEYGYADILMVDGGHSTEVVLSDITHYSDSVPVGGYMIIDDSANNMPFCGYNYFWGLQQVSDVVDSILPPKTPNDKWEHIGAVMHDRVFKRIK